MITRTFLLFAISLLASGCIDRVGNKTIVDSIADLVKSQKDIPENILQSALLFDASEYVRSNKPDINGNYSYTSESNQKIKAIYVDNVAHYAGLGSKQQRINITFGSDICLTSDLIRSISGIEYQENIQVVHVLDANGGYAKFDKERIYSFPQPTGIRSWITMDDQKPCSKGLSVFKSWNSSIQ